MATEKYTFFNSEGDDRRRYNAFDFADYFSDLFTNGVASKAGDELKVSAKEGMTLKVTDGSAFISGYRYKLVGGDMTIAVPLASGLNRVDRVVLRLNLADRSMRLFVKPGTASPPALTRTGTVWELSLARVTARAGVSVISASDIVDERADPNLCGWLCSVVDSAGCIVLWSGAANAIPSGWVLCNGQNGTPNLRDKFVVGAGGKYDAGNTGGEESHTLIVSEIPQHYHTIIGGGFTATDAAPRSSTANMLRSGQNPVTESAGGGASHNNLPPYYALCYIMKL